jgi:hypothetical protein
LQRFIDDFKIFLVLTKKEFLDFLYKKNFLFKLLKNKGVVLDINKKVMLVRLLFTIKYLRAVRIVANQVKELTLTDILFH